MEKWLLLNQSASIRHSASINGWSLFYKCFGVKEKAVEMFTKFINETSFNTDKFDLEEYAAQKIYNSYCKYIYRNLDDRSDSQVEKYLQPFIKAKRDYSDIVPHIESLINEDYLELHIYIFYDRLHLQIRFIYLSNNNEWKNDLDIIKPTDENYYKFLALHAHAEILQNNSHKTHLTVLHLKDKHIKLEQRDIKSVLQVTNMSAEKSFYLMFEKWKKGIIK